MKLELKHLAPYLPYKLTTDSGELTSIIDCDFTEECELKIREGQLTRITKDIADIKPILHSLSDIENYKEELFIEFGGSFHSVGHFQQHFIQHIKYSTVYEFRYNTIEWLIKNHFDIFGLIPKGLAIDINTTKQ